MDTTYQKIDFVLKAALRLHRDGITAPDQENLPWNEEETYRLMGIAFDLTEEAFKLVEDEI